MRRLPIYFLIDVSESMVGEPIQNVEKGIADIITELKKDPVALETVWISIIVYAGQAKTIVPLQDIISFYPPKFPIGSGTELGKGLGHLMYSLRKDLVKTTKERKGDWKPIIFHFTDGVPTDDPTNAINEWNQNWKRTGNIITVSFGNAVDYNLLGKLSDTILELENTTSDGYREFFKWVTDSIKTSSTVVDPDAFDLDLKKDNSKNLKNIDLKKVNPSSIVDNNFVVLSGKCKNTKKDYLMKYEKQLKPSAVPGLDLNTQYYKLQGAFPLDDSYKELSSSENINKKINTEELMGFPTCPCCGNQIAFAVCACGQIHCLDMDEEVSTCPNCGIEGRYGTGGGGIDVNRKQG